MKERERERERKREREREIERGIKRERKTAQQSFRRLGLTSIKEELKTSKAFFLITTKTGFLVDRSWRFKKTVLNSVENLSEVLDPNLNSDFHVRGFIFSYNLVPRPGFEPISTQHLLKDIQAKISTRGKLVIVLYCL